MKLDFLQRKEVKIFLTIFIIYTFFISNYGGNYMANSILYASRAFVDHGNFIIDPYMKEEERITGCDHALYEGKFYSGFAPGATFLGIPIYFIFKPILNLLPSSFEGNSQTELIKHSQTELINIALNILSTIFISILFSSLLGVLLYKFLGHFTKNEKYKLTVTFILSFATIFFLYSTGYCTRILAGVFGFSSFYLLFNAKHKINSKEINIFLAGLLAALGVAMEYTFAITFLILFAYSLTFLRRKKILIFLAGAAIPFILVLSYHYSAFDNPFKTAYSYRADQTVKSALGKSAIAATFPKISKLWVYSFSQTRGYFFYMPILLFSLYGIYIGFKKRYNIEMLTILLIFLCSLIYVASLEWGWIEDGSFGPRYLVSTIPFMVLPLIFAIKKTNYKVFVGVGGLSAFINLLPVLYGRTGLWSGAYLLKNPLFQFYLPTLFKRGLTNYSLNLIKYKAYDLPIYLINIITLISIAGMGLILWFIWKSYDITQNPEQQ